MNDGRIKKGQRFSPATEFKPGQHWRPHGKHREKNWLEHQYVTLGRSAGDIAREVGFTEPGIRFWLVKHGIPRRSLRKAVALACVTRRRRPLRGADNPMFGKTGSLNPNYKDGSSPERQRSYAQSNGKLFLRSIYERDGWCCVRCFMPNQGRRRGLHAHHIAPWAGHEELRFDPSNVVTLCRRCHSWVHSKGNEAREYLA